MTLNEILKMASQWRENDAKRYSVEFYSKDSTQKIATGIKKTIRTV